MKKFITILLSISASTLTLAASPDKTEHLNGVNLVTNKDNSVRSYSGVVEKSIPQGIKSVMRGITNFTDKCNNNYKSKRVFTEGEDCKYFNENLIETFVLKDIKRPKELDQYKESYIVGRKVYNRGEFGYYELVTVREATNEKKQKVVYIDLTMLSNDEVRNYTDLKIDRSTAFDSSTSSYQITEVSPKETIVRYEYSATTKHWLLNKELAVPQVFASISQNINILVKSIEDESSNPAREVASQN